MKYTRRYSYANFGTFFLGHPYSLLVTVSTERA